MIRCLAVFSFLFISISTFSQNKFPNEFIGVWEGNITIYDSNSSIKMTIPMELHIDSTKNDSIWSWEMHYLMPNQN